MTKNTSTAPAMMTPPGLQNKGKESGLQFCHTTREREKKDDVWTHQKTKRLTGNLSFIFQNVRNENKVIDTREQR